MQKYIFALPVVNGDRKYTPISVNQTGSKCFTKTKSFSLRENFFIKEKISIPNLTVIENLWDQLIQDENNIENLDLNMNIKKAHLPRIKQNYDLFTNCYSNTFYDNRLLGILNHQLMDLNNLKHPKIFLGLNSKKEFFLSRENLNLPFYHCVVFDFFKNELVVSSFANENSFFILNPINEDNVKKAFNTVFQSLINGLFNLQDYKWELMYEV